VGRGANQAAQRHAEQRVQAASIGGPSFPCTAGIAQREAQVYNFVQLLCMQLRLGALEGNPRRSVTSTRRRFCLFNSICCGVQL